MDLLYQSMIKYRLNELAGILERKKGRILAGLVLLLLISGSLYSFLLGSALRYLPDEREYVNLADRIVATGTYTTDEGAPTAYRPPGYPLFLAIFHSFGAGIIFYRLLNFALLAGCLFLISGVLDEKAPRLASLIGPVLVLGYPVIFYTAGTLYPQMLASFLLLLSLYLVTRERYAYLDFAFAGFSLGFLILTVPTFVFVLILLAGWHLLQPGWRRWKEIFLALAIALLVVSVWTARNLIVFDRFVFVSSNSGENLLLGNSENTTPNAGTNVDISGYKAQAQGMDEIDRDRFFQAKAFEYIRSHPLDSLKLYFFKVLNYFNYRNELVTSGESSPAKDALVLLSYGPLLIVFLIRLALVKLVPPTSFELLLILLYFFGALTNALFFTRIRFRVPFDFALIMVVAINLARIIDLAFSRSGMSAIRIKSLFSGNSKIE
jgi:4-amino-4-deoxy-L-arabinose transferase-like glycosyltransferase